MSFHKERSRLVIYQSIWLHDKNDKMKTKKHYTFGTFPKFNKQNRKKANSIPLTHKYMTAHFPDFAQALQ